MVGRREGRGPGMNLWECPKSPWRSAHSLHPSQKWACSAGPAVSFPPCSCVCGRAEPCSSGHVSTIRWNFLSKERSYAHFF